MSQIIKQEEIIPEFIRRAISKEVERATAEELTEAQKRIEKRKIEIVSYVMLDLSRYMSIEKMQDTYKFIIEIK